MGKKENEMETKKRQLKHKEPNKAALKIGDTNLHFQKFLIKYFQKLPFIKWHSKNLHLEFQSIPNQKALTTVSPQPQTSNNAGKALPLGRKYAKEWYNF